MASRRLPLLRKEQESVLITPLSAAALTAHNGTQSLLNAKARNDAQYRLNHDEKELALLRQESEERESVVSARSVVSALSVLSSRSMTTYLSNGTKDREAQPMNSTEAMSNLNLRSLPRSHGIAMSDGVGKIPTSVTGTSSDANNRNTRGTVICTNSVLQAKQERQLLSKKRTQTKDRIVREVIDITLPDSAQFNTGSLVTIQHTTNPFIRTLKHLHLWPLTLHEAVISGSYNRLQAVVTRILKREEVRASENGGLSRFTKRRRGNNLYEITEIDGVDECGRTALIIAVKCQRLDMVKLLINAGADVDVVESKQGNSPLMFAIMHNNTALTLALLLAGASVELCNFKCTTPLMMSCATKSRSINLVKTVCSRDLPTRQSVRVNAQDENGWTPLHYAVYAGRANFVAYLIEEQGANTQIRDYQRYKPIHLAVFMRHGACEQELLKFE